MGMPEDRAAGDVVCPTCGQQFDDPLEARNHELEMHGGEGPGSQMGSGQEDLADEQETQPGPSVS
jgi:uncharacterized Zn finger protein (UPF0148 family)